MIRKAPPSFLTIEKYDQTHEDKVFIRRFVDTPQSGRIDYLDMKAAFEEDLTLYGNRLRMWSMYDDYGSVYNGGYFYRDTDDSFTMVQGNDAAAVGIQYGVSRTVNGTVPLFVETDYASPVTPVDPLRRVASYPWMKHMYVNCTDGASATVEFITPMRFRYFALQEEPLRSSTAVFLIRFMVTYSDDTSELIMSKLSGGTIYLFGHDSQKLVKKFELTYVASDNTGLSIPYKLNLTTGRFFRVSEATVEYTDAVPVWGLRYLYGYQTGGLASIPQKHTTSPADITSNFTITSSLAVNASYPITNLTDNNSATEFRTTATTAAMTLTLTPSGNALFHVHRVEIDLPYSTVDGTAVAYQQSLTSFSVAGNVPPTTTNVYNTVRGIYIPTATNAITVVCSTDLLLPHELINRLTITVGRSVTGVHTLSGIRVYGWVIQA